MRKRGDVTAAKRASQRAAAVHHQNLAGAAFGEKLPDALVVLVGRERYGLSVEVIASGEIGEGELTNENLVAEIVTDIGGADNTGARCHDASSVG